MPHAEKPMSGAQQYINDMVLARGYVLLYCKLVANVDMPVLNAANELVAAAYMNERRLSKVAKELMFIASLTVLRASHGQIASHIRVALDLGVSPEDILEAIEIALPEAGVVAFQHGFQVWADVVGAKPLEPSVKVHGSAE